MVNFVQNVFPSDKRRDDLFADSPTAGPVPQSVAAAATDGLGFSEQKESEQVVSGTIVRVHGDLSTSAVGSVQRDTGIDKSMLDPAGPHATTIVTAEVLNAEQPPVERPPRLQPAKYHPACVAAAQQEVSLAMSKLYFEHSRVFDLVSRLPNEEGTCKVQLLRSIGRWSIGTKLECSILNCYMETIKNSHSFVYIENQFFIGSTAGDGAQNGIPQAIVERILRAYESKRPFRAIVVIPLHPNGDFCDASKAKVVMHYEYTTINRGVNSIFEQLRKRAPGINVNDYIGFFCLRNWGVINKKVVTEQIYVHDKLLIVDDRIVIVGSANINDRSMLGPRDSEVAIRIEDTLHIDSIMANSPHTVGYLPHSLRLKLMRQHVGDETFGENVIIICSPC